MKRIIIFALICAISMLYSCKKDNSSNSNTENKSQYLVGQFTRTKLEVSKTNNDNDWKDLTSSYGSETITFSNDGTFVKQTTFTEAGNWEIPLNGNTIIIGALSYDIITLNTHTLTIVEHLEPTGDTAADGNVYKHWRYTYTK
jgi:hypothetical protein